MFKHSGRFEGTILRTMIAEPRFNKNDPNAFDICLEIQGPDYEGKPQIDWWAGEFSSAYGKGNMSNKTQAQITMKNLSGIGFEGYDLSTLDTQLKGKKIPFTVESREYNGNTYYDIKYIGGSGFEPKAIDTSNLQARMAAIMPNSTAAVTATSTATEEDDIPWD
jgi:hypothetical protein